MSNNPQPGQQPQEGFVQDLEARIHWFRKEYIGKHGTKFAVALAIILIGVVAFYQYRLSQKDAQLVLNETLGRGYQALLEGKSDSAQMAFAELIAHPKASSLQKEKAGLLLGTLRMQLHNLDGAAEAFQVAKGSDAIVLRSGAEHGLAVVAMEKKDWANAASLLETYVKNYGLRTGNLQDRFADKEPIDPITMVPDALWKLTLVYHEMKDDAKAKATAERLVKVYGDSPFAALAKKFLATL